MKYTVLARTETGSKLLFAGKAKKPEILDFVRTTKQTFPEWQLTAYRVNQRRNVEQPILRA